MLSPGTKRIDRPEEFAIAMKTLGVQETLRMVLSCMRVTDLRWTVRLVATVGRSLRFTGSAARMFLTSLPCVDT
jgi:hypothetical protein